jgi:hypothetical protein
VLSDLPIVIATWNTSKWLQVFGQTRPEQQAEFNTHTADLFQHFCGMYSSGVLPVPGIQFDPRGNRTRGWGG